MPRAREGRVQARDYQPREVLRSCACDKDPYAHYHHEGFTGALTPEEARQHADHYHAFHGANAWLETPPDFDKLINENKLLKARIIRLELKLYPVIEEKQCG